MQVESRLPHEQRAPVVFNALPKFLPLSCKGIPSFFWRFLTGVFGIIFQGCDRSSSFSLVLRTHACFSFSSATCGALVMDRWIMMDLMKDFPMTGRRPPGLCTSTSSQFQSATSTLQHFRSAVGRRGLAIVCGNKTGRHHTLTLQLLNNEFHTSHTAGGSGAAAAENPRTQPHGLNVVVMRVMPTTCHDVSCNIATKLGISCTFSFAAMLALYNWID